MSVIEVRDVHKKFKVYYDKGQTFKEKLLFKNRNYYEDRWVLKGVDFTLNKGETLGLIGENGCGKSTLLKLMTRIMYPDQGEIKIQGRVSSLIELGAGFHPDMSGRENIYTNASIFGLTKKDIDKRLQDIIDFSELKEFIDNPVRTYSSGMYMRLAFSVAINVDADVLLIDEILAVGDANFQAKCFNRLRELKADGMTIVLVTHDTVTVERFCDYVIWLNDGTVVSNGVALSVIDNYMKFMNDKRRGDCNHNLQPQPKLESDKLLNGTSQENLTEEKRITYGLKDEISQIGVEIEESKDHFGMGCVTIDSVVIADRLGKPTMALDTNSDYTIKLSYTIHKEISGYVFGYGIYTIDNLLLVASNTQLDRFEIIPSSANGTVTLHIGRTSLLPGEFYLQIAVVDSDGTPMDFYRRYCKFSVISEEKCPGLFSLPHHWTVEK